MNCSVDGTTRVQDPLSKLVKMSMQQPSHLKRIQNVSEIFKAFSDGQQSAHKPSTESLFEDSQQIFETVWKQQTQYTPPLASYIDSENRQITIIKSPIEYYYNRQTEETMYKDPTTEKIIILEGHHSKNEIKQKIIPETRKKAIEVQKTETFTEKYLKLLNEERDLNKLKKEDLKAIHDYCTSDSLFVPDNIKCILANYVLSYDLLNTHFLNSMDKDVFSEALYLSIKHNKILLFRYIIEDPNFNQKTAQLIFDRLVDQTSNEEYTHLKTKILDIIKVLNERFRVNYKFADYFFAMLDLDELKRHNLDLYQIGNLIECIIFSDDSKYYKCSGGDEKSLEKLKYLVGLLTGPKKRNINIYVSNVYNKFPEYIELVVNHLTITSGTLGACNNSSVEKLVYSQMYSMRREEFNDFEEVILKVHQRFEYTKDVFYLDIIKHFSGMLDFDDSSDIDLMVRNQNIFNSLVDIKARI